MRQSTDGTEGSDRSDAEKPVGRTPEIPRALEALLATSPEPAVVAVPDGTVLASNDAFTRLTGGTSNDGDRLTSLFPSLTTEAVEGNCGADPGEYVTVRAAETGGADVWLDLCFERYSEGGQAFVVGVAHDVTARRKREQLLEQYERTLETIEDGVYTLDESFTIQTVNSAIESMTGYDEEELVGESATVLADDAVIDRAAGIIEGLTSGDQEFATLTAELETADGGSLPIETRFSTYQLDDGRRRPVGVVRDISDRRRTERALTALHDSTRELFAAETTEDVGRLVAESTTDVLDVTGAVVYRFDSDDTVLRPTAVAGDIADHPDDCRVFGPQSAHLWEAYIEDSVVTVDSCEVPVSAGVMSGGACLPLGEYGVLYAATDHEGGSDTIEVLDLLAASAEVALARVNREQALRERDEKLRSRNAQLRQIEEVNAIIRRIDQILVDADTADEIEQAVCDRLAASRWFSFAWIGRVNGTELDPAAWAGTTPSYLDSISMSLDGDGGPPAVRAARSEGTTVVTSVADDLRSERWRSEAVSANFQSAVSVPLQYEGVTYGVLTVYGTSEDAFDEMVQSVLTELGGTIANAIRDVESRQRRSATSVVELDVALSAPTSVLRQLVGAIGERIVFEGAVPESGDTTRVFFRTDGEQPPGSVRERAADLTRVASLTVISEEGAFFEAVVTGDTVVGPLLDQGARVASVRAEPDSESIVATVRLSSGVEVRPFVERLDGSYEEVQLVARRKGAVSDHAGRNVWDALDAELTDRQLQVLRTAYLSGFFEWPRKSTGRDLADRLDISQPTMSRHLRVGERKLLAFVFEHF